MCYSSAYPRRTIALHVTKLPFAMLIFLHFCPAESFSYCAIKQKTSCKLMAWVLVIAAVHSQLDQTRCKMDALISNVVTIVNDNGKTTLTTAVE